MSKTTGRSTYYSVRQAAWILNVEPASVTRAIRVGTLRAVCRNGRRVVPATALTRLLGKASDNRAQSRARHD